MTLQLSQQTFLWQHFEDLLSIWGESPVVPTLFTLRRKRKTPDWLSSYNTTGLADLCADFDANEVDKVDFESESSCWSDSSTDDSIEDESGDDNLGLDFFRFLMLFFTSRVNMYTVLLIKVYESYIIV